MAIIIKEILIKLDNEEPDIIFRLSGNKDFVVIENESNIYLPIPIGDWNEVVLFIEKEKNRKL